MSQTILTNDGSKSQTKLERLYAIRKRLYSDMNKKLQLYKIRLRDTVVSFRQEVKDIDKEIDIEIHRLKSKDKNTENT